MKGIFYTVTKQPMPAVFVRCILDTRKEDMRLYERPISDMVPWQHFGDDAFMCRYRILKRPDLVGIDCLMQFYNNRIFFGQAVDPKEIVSQWQPSRRGSKLLVPRKDVKKN